MVGQTSGAAGSKFAIALVLAVHLSIAGTAQAQGDVAPRFEWAALGITPSLTVGHLGIDTNVFSESEHPKRDFSANVTSQLQMWLRLAALRITGATSMNLVHFNTYTSQRSVNTTNSLRFELPLARVQPFVETALLYTRDPGSIEIDTRARRTNTSISTGASVRLTGTTSLEVSASRSQFGFDRDATFRGVNLAQALNQRVETGSLSARFELTPLTALVLGVRRHSDRFALTPDRDSATLRGAVTLEFQPDALLSGKATVGYQRFDPKRSDIPNFTGLVTSVDLAYALFDATQFTFAVQRDVGHSYDPAAPYYVQTGFSGGLTQRLGSAWAVRVSAGAQSLNYRRARHDSGASAASPTSDTFGTYAATLTYDMTSGARIGMRADYIRRRSAFADRSFEGLRFGPTASLSF
jgi:hypothetical protein